MGKCRVRLAAIGGSLLLTATCLTAGGSVASASASPGSLPIPDPGCTIAVSASGFKSGGGIANIRYYYVTFSRTCGYPVSSFYHANLGLLGGTQWLYGPTLSGSSGTSQLDTQSQGACTYGWRYKNASGWQNTRLGGPGC